MGGIGWVRMGGRCPQGEKKNQIMGNILERAVFF